MLSLEDEKHFDDHKALATWIEGLVGVYRPHIHIEDMWSISVIVCCPEDLPSAEATMQWHADTWRAELRIRCALIPDLVRWLVIHELLELAHWQTANFVDDLLASLKRFLGASRASTEMLNFAERHYRRVRNQEIERCVSLVMHAVRPYVYEEGK